MSRSYDQLLSRLPSLHTSPAAMALPLQLLGVPIRELGLLSLLRVVVWERSVCSHLVLVGKH